MTDSKFFRSQAIHHFLPEVDACCPEWFALTAVKMNSFLANQKDIGYKYLFYKIHTFPKALRVAERAVSGNGGLTQRRRVWRM